MSSRHAEPVPLPLLRRARTSSRARTAGSAARCLRAFAVTFLGQVARPEGVPSPVGRRRMTAATTSRPASSAAPTPRAAPPRSCATLVSHVGAELELAPAEHIIEWAVATFGERFCITSSMGDAVLAHLAVEGRARHRRGVPRHRLPLRRDDRHPRRRRGDPAGQPADHHARADRSPSRTRRTARTSTRPTPTCAASCARSSRWPTSLAGYDAWATGLRRAETHNRVIAPVVGWDARKGKVKVSPLARWSDDDSRALHRRQRRAGQPARLRRLPVDRLLRPARAGSPPATTRAAGAGPAPTRPSAASIDDPPDLDRPPTRHRRRTSTRTHENREEADPDGRSRSGGPGSRQPGPPLRRHHHRPRRRGALDAPRPARSSARSSTCPSRRSTTVDRPAGPASTTRSSSCRCCSPRPSTPRSTCPSAIAEAPARHPGCGSGPRRSSAWRRASSRCSTCGCARRSRPRGPASSTRSCWPPPAPATRWPTSRSPGWPGCGAPTTSCRSPRRSPPPRRRPPVRRSARSARRAAATSPSPRCSWRPGFLPDRAAELALEAGAVAVSEPLGAHPEIARTVLARYAVGAVELVPV